MNPDAVDEQYIILDRRERRRRIRRHRVVSGGRAVHRPFRRAFGRGERWRMTLLACGEAKLKENS